MKKIFTLLLLAVMLCSLDSNAAYLWEKLRGKELQLESWYREDGVKHSCPDQYLMFDSMKLSDVDESLKGSPDDMQIEVMLWINCDDGDHLDWVTVGNDNKLIYKYRITDDKEMDGWMKVLNVSGNKVTTLDNIGIYRDYIIK